MQFIGDLVEFDGDLLYVDVMQGPDPDSIEVVYSAIFVTVGAEDAIWAVTEDCVVWAPAARL